LAIVSLISAPSPGCSVGGAVNFDTHGDGGGESVSYQKGRGVAEDSGVLEAAFDGNHGWFWRKQDRRTSHRHHHDGWCVRGHQEDDVTGGPRDGSRGPFVRSLCA
jgi:hypothetical protein